MFDEAGERSDAGGAAVYTLTAGSYWCMLAESNGEATLFDAPEGMHVWDFQIAKHGRYYLDYRSMIHTGSNANPGWCA